MENKVTTLKNIIKSKMIKDISVNFENNNVDFQISLTDHDYRILKKEADNINITKHELDKLIDKTREEINFKPKIKDELKIIPTELKTGQHIRLITKDEKGEAIEELIYMSNNSFILVRHERGSLKLLDELRSISSPWNIGGHIDFHVFRDGKRLIKEAKYSVYRTKNIVNIQKLIPQFDFEKFFKSKKKTEESIEKNPKENNKNIINQ